VDSESLAPPPSLETPGIDLGALAHRVRLGSTADRAWRVQPPHPGWAPPRGKRESPALLGLSRWTMPSPLKASDA
jgi:hypothetical protein